MRNRRVRMPFYVCVCSVLFFWLAVGRTFVRKKRARVCCVVVSDTTKILLCGRPLEVEELELNSSIFLVFLLCVGGGRCRGVCNVVCVIFKFHVTSCGHIVRQRREREREKERENDRSLNLLNGNVANVGMNGRRRGRREQIERDRNDSWTF